MGELAMTEAEWGYLAGIIDGEGCISLDHRAHPILIVGNTSEALILWLRDHVAQGSVQVRSSHWNPKHKKQWAWRLAGQKIGPLLIALLPYLVIKKAQAELVIAVCGTIQPYHSGRGSMPRLTSEVQRLRESHILQLRALNKRGLPLAS